MCVLVSNPQTKPYDADINFLLSALKNIMIIFTEFQLTKTKLKLKLLSSKTEGGTTRIVHEYIQYIIYRNFKGLSQFLLSPPAVFKLRTSV